MTERDVFIAALRWADPTQRKAYLNLVCAGDETLRQRVDRLLEAHRGASALLKQPAPFDASTSEVSPPPDDATALDPLGDQAPAPSSTQAFEPAAPGATGVLSHDPARDLETIAGGSDRKDSDGFDAAGLAEFEILAELGRGGMGVVYKARHRQLNRIVALKMIGEGKHASPEVRKRFLIEAQAVARLHHPNIVQIYDIGEADGRPYVTLELLGGGSLADRLQGTTQPGRTAAALVQTLAIAMHAAHQAGIVHRDLKPANILFDADGVPRITDFGLAKWQDVEEGHTRTGQVMGTPCYMSPEQAQGDVHRIGPAADVYALGAILYEMLAGRPPFKGASVMETLHQVVYDDVVPPSRVEPRIARDLETICLKCLEKEPARRYSTAQELADDLRRYLDNRPVLARRTPVWERGAKWVRRRPATATLLGLAAAALISLAVGYARHEARIKAETRAANQRVAERRADSERMLDWAQAELLARHWRDGTLIGTLSNLVTELKDEPRLADMRDRARRMLEQAERGLQAENELERDRQRQRRFLEQRNEALFAETRFTGLDLPVDVQATRTAARAALEVFGSGPDDAWTLAPLPATFSPQEHTEIGDACYELLLVLAAAVAQPQHRENPRFQADAALRILDRAAVLRPRPTPSLLRERARCRALEGDEAGAARERDAADRLHPTTVLDHFLAGREAFLRQDWKTAVAEFDTVARMQPDHFWALCLGAIAAIQTNQPGMAKLGLNACVRQQPLFAWLYVLRGVASSQAAVQARTAAKLLQEGAIEAGVEDQFEAAEDDYRKALAILDRQRNDEVRWAALVDRALLRFQRGRLEDSVADLEAAIRLDGRHYLAFASLAQVLQRQRKWDEAVERFTQAIRLKPEEAALYRGRAAVALERDDQGPEHRAEALRDLDAAIRYETPGHRVAAGDHLQRGELLRHDRRFDDALAACDAALATAPDLDAAHRLRVMVLLDLNRFDDVIRSCDGALARGKPWPDIYEVRGLARASRGDYAGAIDDYSHALYLHGGQPRLLSARGWAWVFSDAPRQALHDFDKALRHDASNSEAHSGRGLALVQLGDHAAAIAAAEESLRHDPPTARRAYNAARIYAQAAVAAAAEAREKGRLAVLMVERYQDRAVVLLKLALERTPAERRASFWRDQISADPALRPLLRRLRAMQPAGASTRSGKAGPTEVGWVERSQSR
jgi:tetratricopeptide (TPR) repeat protein/tRNA A-37 threonylcarbamoyl transferase component Bud32